MDLRSTFVRKNCSPTFTRLLRIILYHTRLTWGAKCLAFALLDLPVKQKLVISKLARKIKSSPQQVSVWKRELLRNGFIIEFKNNQP